MSWLSVGLGAVWGEQQARQLLADAGFAQVESKIVPEDAFNYYYVATKYVRQASSVVSSCVACSCRNWWTARSTVQQRKF